MATLKSAETPFATRTAFEQLQRVGSAVSFTAIWAARGEAGYRPDVAGWRRSRSPQLPVGRPVLLRPDWICEVLSDSNRANDMVRKLRRYHEAGVPHYWLLDPDSGTLNVFRHGPEGYTNVLVADRHQRVRAEPFEVMEVHVGALLGDDPP